MSLIRSISYVIIIALGVFALSAYQARTPHVKELEIVDSTPVQEEVISLSFPEAVDAPKPRTSISVKGATSPAQTQNPAISPGSEQAPQNQANGAQATRIQNPYSFPPFSDEVLNNAARMSLVNIFCTLKNGQSVTGSGVVIDPRGIVLTNAHIGQYVLLSETLDGISCLGRTGTPAKVISKFRVVYVPAKWVDKHAKDLRSPKPTGTGEHDYMLLSLEAIDGTPLVIPPYAEYDTREAVTFQSDQVILASYPAGFIGGTTVQNNLYPATTFTNVRELFTFTDASIDLLSLGGVILAQGGSSGGTVMNRWGRLVGLIVTTSEGETTAERDLRAITLAHVDRSMREHTGIGLAHYIDADLQTRTTTFRANELPALAKKLIDEIPQ